MLRQGTTVYHESSFSIFEYSQKYVNVLKQQLQKHTGKKINFVIKGDEEVNEIYYRLEDPDYSKGLCIKNKASNIIASHSEIDVTGNARLFRPISYRIIDCLTLKEFKNGYYLDRDELHDRFGFEVSLHTTFKDFY